MAQRCIRFSDSVEHEVENAVRSGGYASAAAFVRTAVEHELKQRQEFLQSEREIAATLEQHRNEVHRELRGLAAALNAQFAFLDAYARLMLHCIPEPAAEVYEAAKAQAMQRHEKVLRMAATILKGEANASMTALMGDQVE
jgi:Arc/MetJ-type ribon-helix-helix transcriptional regulator